MLFSHSHVTLIGEVMKGVAHAGEHIAFGVDDGHGNCFPVYLFHENLIKSYADTIKVGDWILIDGRLAVDQESGITYVAVTREGTIKVANRSVASVATATKATAGPSPESPPPRETENPVSPPAQTQSQSSPADREDVATDHAPAARAEKADEPAQPAQGARRAGLNRPGITPAASPATASRFPGRPGIASSTATPPARDAAPAYDPNDPNSDIPF